MSMNTGNQGPTLGQLPANTPAWYTLVVSMIKDVGFPVVMALLLFYLVNYKMDELIKACTPK